MNHNDPLLEPYQLKHLQLKNRIMITSHEPAYPQDGMPKQRYRAYHEEREIGRARQSWGGPDDDSGVSYGL